MPPPLPLTRAQGAAAFKIHFDVVLRVKNNYKASAIGFTLLRPNETWIDGSFFIFKVSRYNYFAAPSQFQSSIFFDAAINDRNIIKQLSTMAGRINIHSYFTIRIIIIRQNA